MHKNIKFLAEAAEIWLNVHDVGNSRSSRFDPIIHLFINQVKSMIKFMMPTF